MKSNKHTWSKAIMYRSLLKLIPTVVPAVMTGMVEISERPRVREVEDEVSHIHDILIKTGNQIRWLVITIVVLVLWNAGLTAYILTQL
jgi:hypothetical protein